MIDLSGQTLTAVTLDEATILRLSVAGGWLVTVEDDYELTGPAGVQRTADGQEAAIVAALGPLVGGEVEVFAVRPDGGLEIGLGGCTLTVPPCPTFEAWNVSGPQHVLVVSTPGGGLATWGVADTAE